MSSYSQVNNCAPGLDWKSVQFSQLATAELYGQTSFGGLVKIGGLVKKRSYLKPGVDHVF
jgi:hypothetical protein